MPKFSDPVRFSDMLAKTLKSAGKEGFIKRLVQFIGVSNEVFIESRHCRTCNHHETTINEYLDNLADLQSNKGAVLMAKKKEAVHTITASLAVACEKCEGEGKLKSDEWVLWLKESEATGTEGTPPACPYMVTCDECQGLGAVLSAGGQLLYSLFKAVKE